VDLEGDRATLRYFADLFVPQTWLSTNFIKETTREAREKPPKTVGSVTIREGATLYYEDILEALLALESQAPNWDAQVISPCPGAVLPFRIESRVTTGVNTPVGNPTVTPVYHALKGGLSFADFADNATSFFVTHLKETAQFLTWQPNGKWIDTWQPEFLYLLINFTPLPPELKLFVEFTFDDGSQASMEAQSFPAPKLYQVYCFPVGFSALELLAKEITEGKQIRKYAVYVTNGAGERISEVRSYQVDRRYFKEDEVSYWLYRNSLGGFDTLRCTGNQSDNLVVEREGGKRFTPYNYGRSFGSSFPAYLSGDTDILANTGYFKENQRAWLAYLQELFYSREIYQLSRRGLLAVELVSKELVSKDSKPNTLAAKLKFRLSHQERNFSKMPRALPPLVRPTAWRFKPGTEFCVQAGVNPNTEPNWQDTGNLRCKFTAPRSSSMTEKEQEDTNPGSASYLNKRWIDDVENAALCPLPVVLNASVTPKVSAGVTGWSVVSTVLGALSVNNQAYQHPVTGNGLVITVSVPAPYKIYIVRNGTVIRGTQSGPVSFEISQAAAYEVFIGLFGR
jgi:hypothetical protein